MIQTLSILAGFDKTGTPEPIPRLDLSRGEVLSILGDTGAGKSQFIEDIETLNQGEGISGRRILINQSAPTNKHYTVKRSTLIAHLCQNMRFVLDLTVNEFLAMRLRSNMQLHSNVEQIELSNILLNHANALTGEAIHPTQLLTRLSGGQSRALMIADVAYNSSAPILLIDELENAGIHKMNALQLLKKKEKTVILVTHDPLIALMGETRLIMKNGGMYKRIQRTHEELTLFNELSSIYQSFDTLRQQLRNGDQLINGGLLNDTTSVLEQYLPTQSS